MKLPKFADFCLKLHPERSRVWCGWWLVWVSICGQVCLILPLQSSLVVLSFARLFVLLAYGCSSLFKRNGRTVSWDGPIHLDLVSVQESLRDRRLQIAKLIFPLLSFFLSFEESSGSAFFKGLIILGGEVGLSLLVERGMGLLQGERNALVVEKRHAVTCHVLLLVLRGSRHEEASILSLKQDAWVNWRWHKHGYKSVRVRIYDHKLVHTGRLVVHLFFIGQVQVARCLIWRIYSCLLLRTSNRTSRVWWVVLSERYGLLARASHPLNHLFEI